MESVAYEGKAIAKLDGFPIFIKHAAPGDSIRAQITKKRSKYAEAKILDILEAGSNRIQPKCIHAGVCGGCSWQHIDYPSQLAFKRQHVEDHLHRIGGLTQLIPLPTIGSEQTFGYRNKMEYSFGDRRWLTDTEIASGKEFDTYFGAGMHAPGRFDRILNLEECFLQSEPSFSVLDFIRSYALQNHIKPFNPFEHSGVLRNLLIRNGHYTNDRMLALITRERAQDSVDTLMQAIETQFPEFTTIIQIVNPTKSPSYDGCETIRFKGDGSIRDGLGSFSFSIQADTFFQTNTVQAEKLYQVAMDFAELDGESLAYDLYCGVGTLSLYLSQSAAKVIGIELNPASIQSAKKNALYNQVSNVEFLQGDAKDLFTADLLAQTGKPELIITDPPRAGMHTDVIQQLLELEAPKIVYVSCNSATLARDLALLDQKYNVERVQPVDMFPQTYHIESVTRLSLR